ncbi:hypothetical protein CPT_Mendera_056 [Stenotrophomonas phage Mendera]|uniref:Uncharacterized protein n=1 Tax=Stenotrophomonas phage Mendera TaxID=2650877 RepID=A0A5P8PIY6_9CAUD|nr:hypothetical protein HWC60_gp056 [Stenotrophomonas phage Mendera]QFR56605.1 hypothetical protein CPT_Mendera_056 [Stenotrophomonas phage Mendera]
MIPILLRAAAVLGEGATVRTAAGTFASRTVGQRLARSGMRTLRGAVKTAPGKLWKTAGGDSVPAFRKALDLGQRGYNAVQNARAQVAEAEKRSTLRRIKKEEKRNAPQQDAGEKKQQAEAQQEVREQENAQRQQAAHADGMQKIAEEGNHVTQQMANDIAEIKEIIANPPKQEEESGFLTKLMTGLIGVFGIGVTMLQAKITGMIAEFGAKLGLKTLSNMADKGADLAARATGGIKGLAGALADSNSRTSQIVQGGLAGAGPLGAIGSYLFGKNRSTVAGAVDKASGVTQAAESYGRTASGFYDRAEKYADKNSIASKLPWFPGISSANAAVTKPAAPSVPTISAPIAPVKTSATGSSTLTMASPTAAAIFETAKPQTDALANSQLILSELLDAMTNSSKGIYTKPADDGLFQMPTMGFSGAPQMLDKPTGVSTLSPGGRGAIPNVRRANMPFNGFGAEVDSHIAEAAQMYGLPEDVLRGFVKMEGGWTGKMSPTGAIGTGQFTQGTWNSLAGTAEGQAIGMTRIDRSNFRQANDPRRNDRTNTLATGLLAKQNADILRRNGLDVTGENLYMLHNIGPGVIPALKGSNSVSASTLDAMRKNGMTGNMSPTDFVKFQTGRFQSHYEAANRVQGVNTGLGKPMAESANDARKTQQVVPVVVQAPTQTVKAPAHGAQSQSGPGTPMVTRNPDSPVRRFSQVMIGTSIT